MSKNIIFMGTPEFSVPTLKILAESAYSLECVYTQPAKKSSRGYKINPSPVQVVSEELDLKIRTPKNLESQIEYDFFKSINPYIVVVVAYGQIIPKKYLTLPEKGFINIHASLLPKWRGAAPIQRSIMNCDKETGISIMKIEEGLDTGPYMKQIKTPINAQTNAKILSDKLSILGAESILESLSLIKKNEAKFIKQENSKATYAKKIKKTESKIEWNNTAKNILSKINSLNPSPGAWFEFNKSRYKVWKAEIINMSGEIGHTINEELTVACKEKSIRILEIQKEGKNKLSIGSFLAGAKIKKGTSLL